MVVFVISTGVESFGKVVVEEEESLKNVLETVLLMLDIVRGRWIEKDPSGSFLYSLGGLRE